jgi:glutamate-5-semialdehyde dehydrogenase
MTDNIFSKVQKASRQLNLISDEQVKNVLNDLVTITRANFNHLLQENKKDLDRMDPSDPKYDRLKLTKERLEGIIGDIQNVAALPSPLEKVLVKRQLPNGMDLTKITVPLGVIGIIYEARPNVTFDVFSLCLKSGNACILKGGSDAQYSNEAIIKLIQVTLEKNGIDKHVAHLLEPSHEATAQLLNAVGFVDIIIPRGSQRLIDYVRQNAKVPVIETGAGIVHTYFDKFADIDKAIKIINNAKTRRVSVCNALDCLIIHQDRLEDLHFIAEILQDSNVTIYADDPAYKNLKGQYPDQLLVEAKPEHFGTEFLDYKMSVKTVKDIDEALEHIAHYSSKHSEAIISENEDNINKFMKSVDASSVYANASTAFTDGAQFGLGAEIGISTQKLHARGPMALEELTSYKWLVRGNGHVRE